MKRSKVLMKDYVWDGPHRVDRDALRAGFVPEEIYRMIHSNVPIYCHDAFIRHDDGKNDGILLARRRGAPCDGELWAIGGRKERGLTVEESLKKKVLKETGLKIDHLVPIIDGNTFHATDPLGHGRGVDTPFRAFYAEGHGELKFDDLNEFGIIVTPKRFYRSRFADRVAPYIRDGLELSMPLMLGMPKALVYKAMRRFAAPMPCD